MSPATEPDFTTLVHSFRRMHDECAAVVNRTVNTTLTLRNWAIGYYIQEYELRGSDRAKYGDQVIAALATALERAEIPGCHQRELYRYRLFRKCYPQLAEAATPLLVDRHGHPAKSAVNAQRPILGTVSPKFDLPGTKLINCLSFSHFAELIELDDPLKRSFYEIECIRGQWSVRTLQRQIATLYFERTILSTDKSKLARQVQAGAEQATARLEIRDPMIFEFLGIPASDAATESDLEAALLYNLKEFLLEMGHGFCLEARQKSIVIGKTRGFVDLVFYQRILKCHVLVELKIDKFTHEHLGQLNTYVNWYRKNMMTPGDSPPIGLLLCTQKDHAQVEYATANMDNQLFVSKYELELPRKAELQHFLKAKRAELFADQEKLTVRDSDYSRRLEMLLGALVARFGSQSLVTGASR